MEKVIILQPDQIPLLWEAIKYSAIHANSLDNENAPAYLHKLLVDLLCSKAICFTAFEEDRIPLGIYVVRVVKDKVTKENYLFADFLYSFKHTSLDVWKERFELIKEYARKEGCKYITTFSNVERVYEINNYLGYTERFRSFKCDL